MDRGAGIPCHLRRGVPAPGRHQRPVTGRHHPARHGAGACGTIDHVSASQSVPPPVALSTGLDPLVAARLKRDAAGLVPAIVQQHDTGEVLMLAWMNDAALHAHAGHRPGDVLVAEPADALGQGRDVRHRQAVHSVALDCDGDTLLVRVDQTGPACHTGAPTCFDDVLLADSANPLKRPNGLARPNPPTRSRRRDDRRGDHTDESTFRRLATTTPRRCR